MQQRTDTLKKVPKSTPEKSTFKIKNMEVEVCVRGKQQ